MTDPLSLAPILSPAERPTPLFADPNLTHEERYNAFVEHVHGGKKVEVARLDAGRISDERAALRRDARQLAS